MTFTTKKFDGLCAVFDPPGNNFPKGDVRLTVEPPERCDALKKNLRLNLPHHPKNSFAHRKTTSRN